MKALNNILRGLKGDIGLKTRGIFTIFLLLFLGAFYSCEGQNKPINIDIDDDPNGWQFDVGKDTVYVDVPYEVVIHDTTFVKVPVNIFIYDTTYIDKIITEYIHDTTFVDKIITIHDTILRDYNSEELKQWAYSYTEADTIKVYSDIIHIDNTDGLQKISEPDVYAMIHGEGLQEINVDTLMSWQRMYNLERIKTFSKTIYNSLDIPFQFSSVWHEGEYLYATINEKQVRITAIIDGEVFKEFNPGTSDLDDNGLWEFNFGIPKTGHLILEVENSKGEIIVYETDIKL